RFLLRFQRLLQLREATLAQRAVGRPVRLVEGAASGVYRPVHVRLRRVRDLSQHLFGGRVDVREGPGLAIDELALDQHPRLEPNFGYLSHGLPQPCCCLSSDGELSTAGPRGWLRRPPWRAP